MKKRMRIISLVLSCIMIIGFVSLSYGADFEPVTGAAFAFQSLSGIKAGTSDVKAAAANPVGSSSDPFYVKPVSGSINRYYLTSTGSVTSQNSTISSFAHIVGDISYSIAYSLQAVCNRINAIGTSYLSDIKTSTSTILGKLGNVESDVDDLRRYFDTTYYQLITSIDNKLTTIKNSAGLGPFIPYYMPDPSVYDYTNAAWNTISVRSATNTGVSTESYTSDSFVRQLRKILLSENEISYQSFRRLFNYVISSDYENETYQTWTNINTGASFKPTPRSLWVDVRYINRYLTALVWRLTGIDSTVSFSIYDSSHTASSVSPISIYDWLRILGTNLSDNLSRLAYVLANDEDIQLRQQTLDQQNAYKTNFTASGAAGRMSGSDIADTAAAGSELKSAFSSSASGRDAFNGFSQGSDGRWDWFSTDILNSLDTTTNNRKSNDNLTNFLDDYYNEVIKYAD